MRYLYVVEGFQRNLPQLFDMRVGIAEKVFKFRGQRSRSYLYICVTAVTEQAYISMVWHQGSLVLHKKM